MDYEQKSYLPLMMLIMSSATSALFDRVLLENSADDLFSRRLEDDSNVMSCDFESPCHWTSPNNQSGWSVASPRQTQPTRKIPATDHSERSSEGHFLLLSSSHTAEDSGRCEFRLTSPTLTGSSPLCSLQVSVFESGTIEGNLTLLIQPVFSAFAAHEEVLHYRRQDNSRAEWEVLEVAIGQLDEPFQVTLLYTSCVREDTTVALDSLEFFNCESDKHLLKLGSSCGDSFHCEHSGGCIDPSQVCNFHTDCPLGEDEGIICDALPFGSYCSFEQDSCGWSVSRKLSSWRRVAGHELVERKDMQGVTLQRTPGHILFLQVRQSSSIQEASVYSSAFPQPVSTEACQMRFSLYVYGDFNGSVSVAVEENGTTTAPLVWERNGPWRDDWEAVALQLTGLQHEFHVKVTAAWERGSSADIALDDIAVGAACFSTDLNSLLPMTDFDDFLSPLSEPSATDVSAMTWWFNSCGASGPQGPTQAQCDITYRNKNVSVTVGKDGALKGVQMWRVPATNRYVISAYGGAGGKGAKNHNERNHGVFISAIFPLEKGEILYILVGHQGEDACPGRNSLTKKICQGESFVIEDNLQMEAGSGWAGGGGGGGGATFIFKMDGGGGLVPLLIAAGGGGNSYLEDSESSLDEIPLEQYENSTEAPSTNGQSGAAGGGGGWRDLAPVPPGAGKSLVAGAEGGHSCALAVSKLGWSTFGGFGGGGGACTAGGGGGGYRGGDAALTDKLTANGQNGISFIHPIGEIFLQPLAAMEGHGECEIKVQLNCSHCQTQSCKRDEDSNLILCLCDEDDVTCVSTVAPPQGLGQMSTSLILAVVVSTTLSGVALLCAGVILSKRLIQFCAQSVPATFHRL